MTLAGLIVRYAAFAAIAIAVNLFAQRLVLLFDRSAFGFAVAILFGTALGLIVKYALDKRWIFFDTAAGLKSQSQKFSLYTTMGVFTTLIFWGTETAFWLIWKTDLAREIGAVLGLTVGYMVKYNLDRIFVFTDAQLVGRATT